MISSYRRFLYCTHGYECWLTIRATIKPLRQFDEGKNNNSRWVGGVGGEGGWRLAGERSNIRKGTRRRKESIPRAGRHIRFFTHYNANASEKMSMMSMPTNSLFSSPDPPPPPSSSESIPPPPPPLSPWENTTEMFEVLYPTDLTP